MTRAHLPHRGTAPPLGPALGLALVLALALAACGTTAAAAPADRPTAGAAATPSPGAPDTLHVVGLGDSVMAGTNCGCAGIVEEYAAGLARSTRRHVTSTDLSDGGLVTDDVDKGLTDDGDQQQALRTADVVLVTIGANDLYPALDQWRSTSCDATCYGGLAERMGRTLSAVLDKIKALVPPSAQVLVTNYWNVFTDGAMTRRSVGQAQIDFSEDVTDAANRQICAAAQAHSDTCVDLLRPFKGTTAHPVDVTPLLAADGDHPDAAGVVVIVRALLAATRTP
ncbi:MAG: hypothetical protein JWR20_1012 [Marmoricola sp.]|nr:hypothetical protein [Marmoricola sp.]